MPAVRTFFRLVFPTKKIKTLYHSFLSGIQVYMILVAESCSALCSSASENLSAVSSSHSLHETMNLLPLKLLRLICSFHLSLSSLPSSSFFTAQTVTLKYAVFFQALYKPLQFIIIAHFRGICQDCSQFFYIFS